MEKVCQLSIEVEDEAEVEKLDWKETIKKGLSLQEVDLESGKNGWGSPPGSYFNVRAANYFVKRMKCPAGDSLLKPLGVDWLKSTGKLEHVMAHPGNLVRQVLDKAQEKGEALKSFIFAVNLQIPGKDHHSAVFYFVTEEPIRQGSLLYRFIHEDDAFRNSRFKLINRIVRGPWIVKAAAGNHAACLLGRALTCHYVKGPNYLEIDVDIASSTVANAILHLALGYVTSVVVDLAFLVESQADDELPEKLLGAVRVAHMEISSASTLELLPETPSSDKCQTPTFQLGGLSWRKLGRSFTFGKAGKVDAEEDAS
ncbi:hypothetical protein MPTK1_6g16230 [Marchantia polymorpha subsp. ruderalis]|nr:hypothetical protein MARPO_0056s0133 [Marchantia polymorpha]BBN15006.1 hypothetical protein Mp_6g16230 [Marchantia polymorpha subsp. ruderalis]|eukprot:PTQ37690.1 hypothetical protein MARPO_0056s0133 [Marchantia polymorpha]